MGLVVDWLKATLRPGSAVDWHVPWWWPAGAQTHKHAVLGFIAASIGERDSTH
jgi:hypothetical protein